jgi:hypothetical protein
VEDVIGDEGRRAATAAARTWARLWGRLPLVDGDSFRDLVAWREMSLLWLAEGFLRHHTAGPRCAELAETALRLLDATGAGEVDGVGLPGPEVTILSRACTARGVLYHGPAPGGRPLRVPLPGASAGKRAVARVLDVFAPRGGAAPPGPRKGELSGPGHILVVPGTGRDPEAYRSLLRGLESDPGLGVAVVPASDLLRWETREARKRASRAEAHLKERRKQLRGAPGLHESYAHGGVGFGDLASEDLDGLLLGHLPAAVRRLEATVELLDATRPALALVAGAERDERRTLLAACTATRTPGVALRAAPPGPEDPDRDDGGPRALATVLWDTGDEVEPVLERLREVAGAIMGAE